MKLYKSIAPACLTDNIIQALKAEITYGKGVNSYSELPHFADDHLFTQKISREYAIQCSGFSITENDCKIEFKFFEPVASYIRTNGIVNSFILNTSNLTGDEWISSIDCEDVSEWVEWVDCWFESENHFNEFDLDNFAEEFKKYKFMAALSA